MQVNISCVRFGGHHTWNVLTHSSTHICTVFVRTRKRGLLRRVTQDIDKFMWTVYEVVKGGKIPKWLPMSLDVLEVLNLRIDNLKATVDETKGWLVDLRRADGGLRIYGQ